MTAGSLSKRYARALLALAVEEGKVGEYADTLQQIDLALSQTPEIKAALAHRAFPVKERQGAMHAILDRLNPPVLLGNFLRLLIQKERIELLSGVLREYRKMSDELEKRVRVRVIAPHLPSEEVLKKIRDLLAKRIPGEIITEGESDPEMIGGLTLKIGHTVYDGSIRRELERMKEHLIQKPVS